MAQAVTNLEDLLDVIDETAHTRARVSLGSVLEAFGTRSFGPLLLLAGVALISPLSGIPGMATSMAVFVLLIAGQLLFHAERIWLPRWILRRSVPQRRIQQAVRWMRRPSQWVDRLLRPRLVFLSRGAFQYVVAIVSGVIAIFMPLMEAVPFTATGAGVALAAFGLSLTTHDGLLALIALLATAVTATLVLYNLLH